MKRKSTDSEGNAVVAKKIKTTDAHATFASLALDPRLVQAITQQKFATPTPVQAQAIPLALDGKDVLARSKTGSGKTLAYLLPILHAILHRKTSSTDRHTSALILVPTKELATQVTATLKTFTAFCAQEVRLENLSRKEDPAVTRSRLDAIPDIVIATPSRAIEFHDDSTLSLAFVKHLVIDEADLVLSYGYEDDLTALAAAIPQTGVQRIFLSATLRTEIDTLTALFFPQESAQPTILDLSTAEAAEAPTLAQYVLPTSEPDKFLLIYTLFKLQLLKGKVIVFVADVERSYRVKLFLEQFGVRSCVLNSELPVNSRVHAVEEFNKGVFDILIASDEKEVVGGGDEGGSKSKERRKRREAAEKKKAEATTNSAVTEPVTEPPAPESDSDADTPTTANPLAKKSKPKIIRTTHTKPDREFGIARGIDFRHVACVLNFDLPTSAKSYTHRIGRTARAGQTGMALSFFVPAPLFRKDKSTSIPSARDDEDVLGDIRVEQAAKGAKVEEWQFDMAKLEGFRYRFEGALRSVTRIAVREARTNELRQELLNSEKLKRHFEENPEVLGFLRHDGESHGVRPQMHLRHVPDYLLPEGGKKAVGGGEVGSVAMRREGVNGLRRRREFNKSKGKGAKAKGRGMDPLKSLNAKGRGKA